MATEFISNSWLMPTNANADANRVSNYSLDFNGIDEAITITRTASIEPTNITVACWVNVNATGSHTSGYFVSKIHTSGASASYGIYKPATPTFLINIGGVLKYSPAYGTDIRGQGWQHLVGTYDGSHIRLYVNGTEVGSGTAQTGSIDYTTENAFIGSFQPSLLEIDGKITETVIYDYALSASQVTELYGTGSAIGNPMAITNGRKPVYYAPLGNSAFNGEFLVPNGAEQDYVFDFTADYIDANSASYLNAVSNFTISTWFTTDTVAGADKFLINIGSSSSELWGVQLYQGDLIVYGGSTAKYFRYNGHIAIGQWYNLVVLYNGNESASDRYKVYLNGSLLSTSSTSGTVPTVTPSFTTNLVIGKLAYAAAAYWNGKISNASIFNTSLPATGAESVASLYNYGTPPNIASYSGLQGWWELDASATFDGSNWSIPDASSNSNTGTSSGMTAANLVQSDLIINAPFDSFSLDFDGSNDYINCGNNLDQSGSSAFSISTWVKYTSGSSICILAKANSGQPGYSLFSITSKIHFYVSAGGTDYLEIKTSSSINDGNWHNILITYDGSGNVSGAKIYIDGSLDTIEVTDSFTGSSSNSTNFQIGARGSTIDIPFLGKISNVSVFNSALSAAQVTTLYNEGKPFDLNTFAVTPVSWWRLGATNSSFDGTNWTVLDEIGTNNGTSANMTQSDLVDGVGATGSGLSSGMSSGTNRTGNSPYSENNAVSYNMSVTAKSSSVPT